MIKYDTKAVEEYCSFHGFSYTPDGFKTVSEVAFRTSLGLIRVGHSIEINLTTLTELECCQILSTIDSTSLCESKIGAWITKNRRNISFKRDIDENYYDGNNEYDIVSYTHCCLNDAVHLQKILFGINLVNQQFMASRLPSILSHSS